MGLGRTHGHSWPNFQKSIRVRTELATGKQHNVELRRASLLGNGDQKHHPFGTSSPPPCPLPAPPPLSPSPLLPSSYYNCAPSLLFRTEERRRTPPSCLLAIVSLCCVDVLREGGLGFSAPLDSLFELFSLRKSASRRLFISPPTALLCALTSCVGKHIPVVRYQRCTWRQTRRHTRLLYLHLTIVYNKKNNLSTTLLKLTSQPPSLFPC